MMTSGSGTPGGRAPRRSEENEPARDYLKRLRAAGPREGETRLAFEARLAGVARGRLLILSAWIQHSGDRTRASRELGTTTNSMTTYLRYYGLSADILDLELGRDPAVRRRNQRLFELAIEHENELSW